MRRFGLSVREVGAVLGLSECRVRRLLGFDGDSQAPLVAERAQGRIFIAPDGVRGLIDPDDPYRQLRLQLLDAILSGRARALRPSTRYAEPPHVVAQIDRVIEGARPTGSDVSNAGSGGKQRNIRTPG